jgi:hypothetical protein
MKISFLSFDKLPAEIEGHWYQGLYYLSLKLIIYPYMQIILIQVISINSNTTLLRNCTTDQRSN